MPQHDRLDLARVLLARAIDDETLVRKVSADTGVADAIVGQSAIVGATQRAQSGTTLHDTTVAQSRSKLTRRRRSSQPRSRFA